MFKKFLLLFPIFRRWEAEQVSLKQEKEDRQKEIIKLLEKEKYWNDLEDKWEAENRRKEDIRDNLLARQKISKLRISR